MNTTNSNHKPPIRSIHLIDIDNLTGGPNGDRAPRALSQYWDRVPRRRGDTVVIAGCGKTMKTLMFDVHDLPCSLKVRNGHDGSDTALLDSAPLDLITKRYDRLVVGSGDHIFAPLITSASAAGLETMVVSKSCSLARSLEAAAASFAIIADVPVAQRRATSSLKEAA